MVETRIVPIRRVVTLRAIVAAAAVMGIVLRVATETRGRRFWKGPVFMTIETRRLQMLAKQRVIRRRMVELAFQPFRWLVARRAVATHFVLVGLIFLVAADTGRWGFPMFQVRRVAAFAVGLRVRARQFEVSKAVIECGLVQGHDIRIPTMVLVVTRRALVSLDFRALAVKSTVLIHVVGYVFMTIKTELSLPLLVEHLVAGGTLALKFGMPRDELSGHYQRLNILSRRFV